MNEKVIDWTDYGDEDIERFLGELYSEREKRRVEKRKVLRKQVLKMLKEQGMSLDEVFGKAGKGRGRPKKATLAGKHGQGEERPVKYRNPADASHTWTGKGRKPGWLVEALASGKKLEEFAV